MTIKTWIPGYEGIYQIDSEGRIYSWKSGAPEEIKMSTLDNGRHLSIELSTDRTRKKFYIHRLVWEAFNLEKLSTKQWIYHIDGNIRNNSITNLRLKNINSAEEKASVKYRVISDDGTSKEFCSISDIAKEYGIGISIIKKMLQTGDWQEVIQKKNL